MRGHAICLLLGCAVAARADVGVRFLLGVTEKEAAHWDGAHRAALAPNGDLWLTLPPAGGKGRPSSVGRREATPWPRSN
jgi:hypothetical protein